MQGFHIPAAPPLYTNTFLLISDAGHAVVIDPAAEVHRMVVRVALCCFKISS